MYCPDLTQKLSIPQDSCIISLYRDQQQNILNSCEIMLAKTRTKLVRATHFQSFLATEGTKIFYKCSMASNPKKITTGSKSLKAGTYRIETNRQADCIISSKTFSYRSYSPLEEELKYEPIAIQSNFMELLNITAEQVKEGVELIEMHTSDKRMKQRNTKGDKPGQKRKDSKVKSKQHVHIDYGNWRDSPHHHNRHQWGGLLVYRHEKRRREIRQLLDKQCP